MTSRGMGLAETTTVADIIADIVEGKDPKQFRSVIAGLCEQFPLPS